MHLTFKIPAEVVEAHGAELRARDWGKRPTVALQSILPITCGFLPGDRLEMKNGVIRAEPIGATLRMRAYADTLSQQPQPTPEEIAAVLTARNPPEQQE